MGLVMCLCFTTVSCGKSDNVSVGKDVDIINEQKEEEEEIAYEMFEVEEAPTAPNWGVKSSPENNPLGCGYVSNVGFRNKPKEVIKDESVLEELYKGQKKVFRDVLAKNGYTLEDNLYEEGIDAVNVPNHDPSGVTCIESKISSAAIGHRNLFNITYAVKQNDNDEYPYFELNSSMFPQLVEAYGIRDIDLELIQKQLNYFTDLVNDPSCEDATSLKLTYAKDRYTNYEIYVSNFLYAPMVYTFSVNYEYGADF